MPSSLNRADSKLTHSGRTLVANSDPQEGPNFVSHVSHRSGFALGNLNSTQEVNPEEYYNQTTEVRLVSRVTHPTDSQPPNNNHSVLGNRLFTVCFFDLKCDAVQIAALQLEEEDYQTLLLFLPRRREELRASQSLLHTIHGRQQLMKRPIQRISTVRT